MTNLERHQKLASLALEMLEDACHLNEAEWSGWGECVVPERATKYREAVQAARKLVDKQ